MPTFMFWPFSAEFSLLCSGQSNDMRVRRDFIIVRAYDSQLTQIGWMNDAGELRVYLERTVGPAEARRGYARAANDRMN